MSGFFVLSSVVGVVLLGAGTWFARLPASDRIVGDVVETIAAETGHSPSSAEVWASVERDRRRAGLAACTLGAVVIAVAFGSL